MSHLQDGENRKKTGYKILRLYKQKSFRSCSFYSNFIYEIKKEYTRLPGWGPYVLFRKLETAIDYVITNPESNFAIGKCIYKESKQKILWNPWRQHDILTGKYNNGKFEKTIRKSVFADSFIIEKILLKHKGRITSWESKSKILKSLKENKKCLTLS